MTIGESHNLKSARFAGDEVLEACYNNRRSLRRGDIDSSVEKVQRALIFLGFPIPEAGASGVFDSKTELAIRSYQEARGLKVDGVVGIETIGSLDEEFHTGPATEHFVSPSTEPYLSDVPSPLVPKSPVKSPKMSPISAPETRIPSIKTLKTPRAPHVERPAVKTPQPPVPPVAEPPILTTQAVPIEQTPPRISRPVPSHYAPPMADSQGRKFHSAGTWKGNSSFEVEAGKSIHLEVTNHENIDSNIQIKSNTGEVAKFVLPSQTAVDLEFSMAEEEPFIWRFYIETDSKKSLIDWKIYSNWVPATPGYP